MRLPLWKRKSMTADSILEIPAGAQEAGHRANFLRLIGSYEPALRRLAGGYLDQHSDRNDLFQEIAVALWQAIPRFRGESSERTWLYRIAHNIAISYSARIRRRGKAEETMPENFEFTSAARNPEQEALRAEKSKLLSALIHALPIADRQVILLHLEGLSYAEIEEVTGLSEPAIATRLTRIREKLKKNLEAGRAGYEQQR